jgi:uncharacterized membrane protein
VVVHQEYRQRLGPLPAPEELAAFNQVLPGLADRITRMAEGHAKNRWANDRATRIVAILSQIFAFVIAMSVILGGLYLTFTGHPVTGLAAVFATIAGILLAIRRGATKKS